MSMNKEVSITTDINMSIKRISKICVVVVNEVGFFLLG